MQQYISLLKNGLISLQIPFQETQLERLIDYILLLKKWNKVYNLTSLNSVEQMISFHLLDALLLSTFLGGNCFIDAGTGAGIPGIPLAILFPEKQFVLLDPQIKRICFLREVKKQLQLNQVEVVQNKVEDLNVSQKFDGLVSRSFTSVEKTLQSTHHLMANHATYYFLKSERFSEERIPEDLYCLLQIHPFSVPGVEGNRYVIIYKNSSKRSESKR